MLKVNEVRFVGNLGDDVLLRDLEDGRVMGVASLAVSSVWYNQKGEKIERTDWVRLTLFEGVLKSVQDRLKKGVRVMVLGELRCNSYQDKEGVQRYSVEVLVDLIHIL